ncbi:ABC transporter permease [Kineococcus terrestris]|uniref:ABC transporter permease n=1 Tax=Kineococcus terrestris TaxID=2044856 RepID=UPI003F6898CA
MSAAAAPAAARPAVRAGTGTWPTAVRVARQLRHDHRTLALLALAPGLLLALMSQVWQGQPGVFDRVGYLMLAVFPLLLMFLVTSIAMLRERTSGTLERLATTPVTRAGLLGGYALAFGAVAAAQAALTTWFALGVLGLDVPAAPGWVLLTAVLDGVLGVALGLLCSAFARTEFQAVQFMPVVVLPQLLLCGLLVPREQMAGWLEAVSAALPMTYAVRALESAAAPTGGTLGTDLAVLAGAALAALALAAATVRRRTG